MSDPLSNEYYQTEEQQFHLTVEKAKPSLWERMGGNALTFAVGLAATALICLGFWYFTLPPKPEKKVDFMPPGGGGGQRGAETKVQTKRQKQIVPSTNVKRVFAEGASSTFTIPEQGDNFGEMSPLASISAGGASGGLGGSGLGKGFGKGNGNGSGMGTGGGIGKLFGLIPDNMKKRCTKEDRLARIAEMGGTPKCEEAVGKALAWLKSKQKPDGSWTDGGRTVSMTGLALLAYFGHCETPASKEYGDSCLRGITFLVNKASQNGGRMADAYQGTGWCYEHAIATYALGEALTFCTDIKQDVPGLKEAVEKAGQFILDNQHKNGGWAYEYKTGDGAHTDTSIVGWHVQALKACSHTPIKFKGMNGAISKALRYVESCQNEEGGIGYTGPRATHAEGYYTLTGVGMLCYQMWDKASAPLVRKGGKYVLENTKLNYNGKESDLYGHYYESQAMMQLGGEYWKKYNEIFREQILANQNPDGSWKAPNGGNKAGIRAVAAEFVGNTTYRTCLCTLMLEVYYRFLSTGGGTKHGRDSGI